MRLVLLSFLILAVSASLFEQGLILYQTCAMLSLESSLEIDHAVATNCFMEEVPVRDRDRAFPIVQLYQECIDKFRMDELSKGEVSFEACKWRL